MILIKLLWILLNVIVAGVHAETINDGRGRDIKHFWWATGFAAVDGIIAYLFYLQYHNFWDAIIYFHDLILLVRVPVFNLSLNAMRKGPYAVSLFYITPELKGITGWVAWKKGKIVDWVHWKIWGNNPELYYIIYGIASVLVTVYFLSKGYEALGINMS